MGGNKIHFNGHGIGMDILLDLVMHFAIYLTKSNCL